MREISKFTDPEDGAEFVLFERETGKNDWRDFKIVATGNGLPKHNWWLSHSATEGRFAKSRDLALLAEHRPAAYEWFLSEVCQ